MIQSGERLKHSISPRNQSAKHPDSGCFSISRVVISTIKEMIDALVQRLFAWVTFFKTWPKPQTVHEKPLAPRVNFSLLMWRNTNLAVNYFSLTVKCLSVYVKKHKSRSYPFLVNFCGLLDLSGVSGNFTHDVVVATKESQCKSRFGEL